MNHSSLYLKQTTLQEKFRNNLLIFSRIVDENVKNRSDVKLTLKTKNVAGVTLPQFGLRNVDEEKCKIYFFK